MLPIEELPQKFPVGTFRKQVDAHPYPLVFATICGAHLVGFQSTDFYYDMRGMHLPPLKRLDELDHPGESIERPSDHKGFKIDFVTHDAEEFFRLILEGDGNVLEQLFSPLVVHTTPEHEELKAIVNGCISRQHARYYLNSAKTQWNQFRKQDSTKVEPLLHVYRVLLTGIHLMRTSEVVADLIMLNETAKLPIVDDLVDLCLAEPESSWLAATDLEFHEKKYKQLVAELESAAAKTALPEQPGGRDALNQLLVQLGKEH